MGLPPTRLRDLSAWITEENSRMETKSQEVWEIGVPFENSLSWSLVLSILFSETDEKLSLTKLIGNEEEMEEEKMKMNMTSDRINPKVITQNLDNFNPFKNRHRFHLPEVSKVIPIFDYHLNRFGNTLKSSSDKWDEDLKLEAACSLLECGITVYFPEEIESRKFLTYPKSHSNFKTNIVLFQYETQQYGKGESPMNYFHFAMTVQQAHYRKLVALEYFLKKAKISNSRIENVSLLMNNPELHGKAFLPAILQSSYREILLEIYGSPYIAFKLSEAGFETDPIATFKEKPSPLFYSLCTENPNYFRILYDYASNCRCLFDRSVRRADDTVLETLTRIKSVLESDICKVKNSSFDVHIVKRGLHILKQLCRFVEYQFKTASELRQTKIKYNNEYEEHDIECKEFEFRKEIIVVILENYLKFFYYESPISGNILQQFMDNLKFTDYYEYMDNFCFASFFDSFYKLRVCFGLRNENKFLNAEWKMFFAILSNMYFSKFIHENECEDDENRINSEINKNVLRLIPVLHRTAVASEVSSFINELKNTSNIQCLKNYMKYDSLDDNSQALEIVDELIITRLNKYLEAALEVSPADEGMRAVLVIERAMQVLGESIKPPSSTISSVSFLLRSCLSQDLQKELIAIRNGLSKYLDKLVNGKRKVEKDVKIFEGIKEELGNIQKAFEVVYFTQNSRIEESMIAQCRNQLNTDLDSNTFKAFESEYALRTSQRKQNYIKYHNKCLNLLFNVFDDLKQQLERERPKNFYFGELKAIEDLLNFILRNKSEKYLENLLRKLQNLIIKNKDKDLEDLKCNLKSELPIFIAENLESNIEMRFVFVAPNIENFRKSLNEKMFSSEEINEIKTAARNALDEVSKAQTDLEVIFSNEDYASKENVEELLNSTLLSSDKINEIRNFFENKNSKEALKSLTKSISNQLIPQDVTTEADFITNVYYNRLLTKITFQRYLNSKFYTSATLPENLCEKLEIFLTKKAHFMISRLEALRDILIMEDEEILDTRRWMCEKTEIITYHSRFLMRQRYNQDVSICASLEAAYLDCVNIFHKKTSKTHGSWMESDPSRNLLRNLYEKSTGLFEGIDLRNLGSHRTNIPEIIGEILDEEDFPSEMIHKVHELIDDLTAIQAMLELFYKCGTLEKNNYIEGIEKNKFQNHQRLMIKVKDCPRWKNYLFLLPLI